MRYFGEVGFAETVETSPGIWEEHFVVRKYRGSPTIDARRFSEGDTVSGRVKSGEILSLVGDKYAFEHVFDIRWAKHRGKKFVVTYAEVKYPRIQLTLGDRFGDET